MPDKVYGLYKNKNIVFLRFIELKNLRKVRQESLENWNILIQEEV